ncbi:SHOCT domain-containing protein [Anaerotignum sp.]
MAKGVINPMAIVGGTKKLVKDMSIGAAVAVVEGGIEIADKFHEVKGKRRKENIELMKELEELKEKGIITQEEFEKKREKVVKKI